MRRFASLAARGIKQFNLCLVAIAVGLLVALSLIMLVSIVMRYGFGHPLWWSIEVVRYMFMAVVVLGLGYAAINGAHIGVDMVVRLLPAKARTVANLLAQILTLIVAVMLTWGFLTRQLYALKVGEVTANIEIPFFYVFMPMVIGVIGLGLQALLEIGRAIATITGRSGQE